MKTHLTQAFEAATHSPAIADYLHTLLKLRFRENGFDIGTAIKPSMHKILFKLKAGF